MDTKKLQTSSTTNGLADSQAAAQQLTTDKPTANNRQQDTEIITAQVRDGLPPPDNPEDGPVIADTSASQIKHSLADKSRNRPERELCVDQPLSLSRGAGGVSKTQLEPWETTFGEMCEFFSQRPQVGRKDGDYFVRGPVREGSPTRKDANLEYAITIVLDCDSSLNPGTGEMTEGAPPPLSVHKTLVELNINHLLYTTHSHGQPGKGFRFRVLIPAPAHDAGELKGYLRWIFHLLHEKGCWLADVKENRAWSQPWLFPRLATDDSEYLCFFHDTGTIFDAQAALAWCATEVPFTKEELNQCIKTASPRDPGSPFAQFNAQYGNPEWILQLLEEQGYKLKNTAPMNGTASYRLLSPLSTSGNAGIILFRGEDEVWRVYSHHNANEPLSRTGDGGSSSDAWDLFRIFLHKDSEHTALAAWHRIQDSRPLISISGGQVAENLSAAVKALADLDPPAVYQRAQSLCRVAHLEETSETQGCSIPKGTAHIVPLMRAGLTVELSKAIRWESYRNKEWRPADPCPKVTGALLEAIGMWTDIPVLVGINEAPILRTDGTLLAESGYDEHTRLYVEGRFPGIQLPDKVSLVDAQEAAEYLLTPFSEFPFVEERLDRSGVLAYIFTLALRPQLPTAPIYCVSATTPGSGKGLLIEVCNLLVRGRDAATMPPVQGSNSEEEMRKRLTALLSEGLASANLDNVTATLGGEAINVLLTGAEWTDRILGASRSVKLPNRIALAATGNNLTVRGDTTRRAYGTQLDAGVERPELRVFSEKNLTGRVLRDRGRLLTALFVILKGYQQAGSPGAQDKPLGRFEAWTTAVCGPIRWLGYPDPLETQERLREQDPEADKLAVLLSAWNEQFADKWTSVSDLIDIGVELHANHTINKGPVSALYEALVEVASDGRGNPNRNKLGWYLRHFTGRIAGGYRLDKKPRSSKKTKNAQQYRVIRLDNPDVVEDTA